MTSPSSQAQFLAALLAFTSSLYLFVWLGELQYGTYAARTPASFTAAGVPLQGTRITTVPAQPATRNSYGFPPEVFSSAGPTRDLFLLPRGGSEAVLTNQEAGEPVFEIIRLFDTRTRMDPSIREFPAESVNRITRLLENSVMATISIPPAATGRRRMLQIDTDMSGTEFDPAGAPSQEDATREIEFSIVDSATGARTPLVSIRVDLPPTLLLPPEVRLNPVQQSGFRSGFGVRGRPCCSEMSPVAPAPVTEDQRNTYVEECL